MDATCFTARALMKRFGLVEDHRVTRIRLPEGPSRRAFLAGLTAVVASGLVDLTQVDTAKLLWEPGKTSFLLPPDVALATPAEVDTIRDLKGREVLASHHRGNQFLSIQMITMEALRYLENNLSLTKNVNREYDSAFGGRTYVGQQVNVRTPRQFTRHPENVHSVAYAASRAPLVLKGGRHTQSGRTIETLHAEQHGIDFHVSGIARRQARDPEKHTQYETDHIARAAGHALAKVISDDCQHVGELPLPMGVEEACVMRSESGLALRGVRYYDAMSDRDMVRIDLKTFK